ncbi:MAG TPA: TetR/AcrR family transcriptional regulator [Thermoanaerobaculia bacterium]|nr:TetR/AcrR family transcriptional regulator [Thermoanaerobaculia bacterium]
MGRPPRITRDQLLETARGVFAVKGFEAATLADIASELGVSPAAILRYFESKQELFEAAMRGRVTAPPDCILELAHADAGADPRIVLRDVARRFIPFVEKAIAENIAIYMHEKSRSVMVPFDPGDADSPPRRGLAIVSHYFRRAMAAGVIRRGDPRGAAMLFMGSLQSYVFMHRVLNVKPYPLDRYIDGLIDLWSHGEIVGGHRGKAGHPSGARRRVGRDRDRNRRNAPVHEVAARTEGVDGLRDTGSAHGQGRLARRRPRHARSR